MHPSIHSSIHPSIPIHACYLMPEALEKQLETSTILWDPFASVFGGHLSTINLWSIVA
jgi:hypothetical protein